MVTVEEHDAPAYRVRPGYVVREVAGEYLLIPVIMQEDLAAQMAVLNESGKFLWEQLQQEKTVADLIAAMTEEYDVSPEEAREDILEFINLLQRNKLVQESGGEK